MKNQKGVTLTVLVITIIIILIISGTVINASTNSLVIRKVNDLFADIESISSKISMYYLENNELPVLGTKYASSVDEFRNLIDSNGAREDIINPNDGDDYYVIDLSKLENLSLNFGRDYENWKNQIAPLSSQYQDIYVINGITHQIYYPKGKQYKNKHFYTTVKNIAKIDRNAGYVVDEDFSLINHSAVFKKNKEENEKVIVTSNIEMAIDFEQYVANTLSYVFTEEPKDEDERVNLSYSKFTLNSENKSNLVSKGLDRLTQKYYLYLRVLDVNGKYHYLEQQVDRLQNEEVGWVLADDLNLDNDWYQYLDTSGTNTVATVNAPKLADGMEAVKYVGENTMDDTTVQTLTTGSRWANAMTKDGSMWVWIPRYAYRITSGYHQSGADINPSTPTLGAGTIEIAFLDTENNFLDPNITGTVVTTGVDDLTYTDANQWILEPAFQFGGDSIDGFWFAKFEASNTYWYGDEVSTADSTALTLQIKPNVTSWRNITSKNIFTVCQELKSNTNYEKYFDSVTNVDTHMTKNVEWGAAAYLAHSKYGLNGQEVAINSNGYITGKGAGDNNYNTTIGITASTTRNIYGIYDMSGGAYEYTAACLDGYTGAFTDSSDTTFLNKYIDIYNGYSISKYGDAVYETSAVLTNSGSWFQDASSLVLTSNRVFGRGGTAAETSYDGIFAFGGSYGNAHRSGSFRTVCVVN